MESASLFIHKVGVEFSRTMSHMIIMKSAMHKEDINYREVFQCTKDESRLKERSNESHFEACDPLVLLTVFIELPIRGK
jgi:hypothetical protein